MFRRVLVLLGALAMLAVPAMAGAQSGFNGPLFGLATQRNGDILAADASTGIIAIRDGAVGATIPLPGVTAVAAYGRGLWATTGAGDSPQADTGQGLYRIQGGQPQLIANMFEVEQRLNPDGNDPFDSNPYDVYALSGQAALVADAGANALYRANRLGTVGVVASFPTTMASTANIKALAGCPESGADFCFLPDFLPAQSTPTSVEVGPDGTMYVGELRGFPGPAGESSVWRIAKGTTRADCAVSAACTKVLEGFTSIIDLKFGPDGRLYVAELDEASWAAVEIFQAPTGGTINACDLATGVCEEVATVIPILTAITFGNDGTLWATRNSLIPGLAEVFAVD